MSIIATVLSLNEKVFNLVWGQPTLYPQSIHACPNETVTYYCHGSHISVIAWEVPPYITRTDRNHIQFVSDPPAGIPSVHNMTRENKFFANLTNITKLNGSVADMTTSLMIITHGIQNETSINCIVSKGGSVLHSSSTLYFAGVLL